jgi:hypothetical protein
VKMTDDEVVQGLAENNFEAVTMVAQLISECAQRRAQEILSAPSLDFYADRLAQSFLTAQQNDSWVMFINDWLTLPNPKSLAGLVSRGIGLHEHAFFNGLVPNPDGGYLLRIQSTRDFVVHFVAAFFNRKHAPNVQHQDKEALRQEFIFNVLRNPSFMTAGNPMGYLDTSLHNLESAYFRELAKHDGRNRMRPPNQNGNGRGDDDSDEFMKNLIEESQETKADTADIRDCREQAERTLAGRPQQVWIEFIRSGCNRREALARFPTIAEGTFNGYMHAAKLTVWQFMRQHCPEFLVELRGFQL